MSMIAKVGVVNSGEEIFTFIGRFNYKFFCMSASATVVDTKHIQLNSPTVKTGGSFIVPSGLKI